ncbi:hypothetical protein [Pleurocapsa sp. PCC 7319]|uniref:hypothetical protein n=1 Tax=Pleurocapsa sp. PCC 7319 TaxID=118161 RepID=UPI0011818602|nr:hypothetical protein [Pleurocapsa sp. PCC 7319]
MQLKKLIFFFVILAFLSPSTANSREIDVEAGDVRIRTEEDGQVSVDTDSNSVEVNRSSRRSTHWWQPWHYLNRDRSSNDCSSSTYQRSTQSTRTNGHVEESSVSTSTCH